MASWNKYFLCRKIPLGTNAKRIHDLGEKQNMAFYILL